MLSLNLSKCSCFKIRNGDTQSRRNGRWFTGIWEIPVWISSVLLNIFECRTRPLLGFSPLIFQKLKNISICRPSEKYKIFQTLFCLPKTDDKKRIPLYVKITLSKKLMKKSKGLLSSAQLNFSSVKHNSAQRKFCKSTTLPLFFSQVYQSLLPRFQVKIFPPIIFKSFHSSF